MTDDDWAAEQQRFAAHFYPGTTVLRNHAGITDAETLRRYEYQLVEQRAVELTAGAAQLPATFDAEHLAGVHRHLFSDVYPFAGQIRDYPLSKDSSNFAHYRNIRDYLDAAAYDLSNSPDIRSKDPDRFAVAISDVFAHINTAHPFREGNGRSTRLFIEQAAAQFAHFRIDLRAVTREQWNDASKASHPQPGTFSPDPTPLVPIFRAALVTPAAQREQPSTTTVEKSSEKTAEQWARGSAAARLAGGAFPRGASTDTERATPPAAHRPQPSHEHGYGADR